MGFDESEYYSEERILLKIEGEYQGYGLTAYCGPDTNSRTLLLGGEFELEEGERQHWKHDGPFPIDVVFGGDQRPDEETMDAIIDELGTEFSARFDEKVSDVYDIIEDAENPLESILALDSDELEVNPMGNDAE